MGVGFSAWVGTGCAQSWFMRVGLGEDGGWRRAVRVVVCGRRGAACTRRAECRWRLWAGVEARLHGRGRAWDGVGVGA